ncbi:MAG: ribonuclease J [Bacilli bacterium]|nr:ribonuclease J [Bacilli bacterium]
MDKKISKPVSAYALGGLGEVGKNMYCFENENQIVIVDCGVKFPGVELPGIDYIVPDFTHLKNNKNKIRALIITHGHEDHIGGIPFLIQNVNIPVIYAPRLACALIKNRLEEYRMSDQVKIVEYNSDSKFTIGDFDISFFRVTHSIPDSFGVVIDTSEGRIVSTGDFKVDLTPIGPDIELQRIAELGHQGVDLLLSDSTNAENEGYTPSEKNVFDSINEIFNEARGRIIVSTFSSNISRIQQICESAVKHNRKIAIVGKSMEKAVDISRGFGYIKIPDKSIITTEEVKNCKGSEVLVLCTGSQGEPNAALSRIAGGEHKDIHIIPGDTVVFSSSAIPGNGIMIAHIVNLLARAGAECITNSVLADIHSSGHPSKQELRLVLKLFNPKYFMPMHGEYRMLRCHAEIAQELGMPASSCFVLDNGDSLTLAKHKVTVGYPVEHGVSYIDGKDIKGLANPVMEDRKILIEDGMFIIAVSIDSHSNSLLMPPVIYNKGVILRHNDKTIDEVQDIVEKAIKVALAKKPNFAELKSIIKDEVSRYIYSKTKRTPMVIPVIMSKN